jgi:tol-pal system protein YbgF
MRLPKVFVAGLALSVLSATGCTTAGGGSQLQNTIYDTHRRVAGIEKSVQSSVGQLNETTAGLLARVDSSDQAVKALQGTVEENTVRLQGLEKKLDALSDAAYRYFGMSRGTRVGGSEATPGGAVRVEPPAGSVGGGEPNALSPLAPSAPSASQGPTFTPASPSPNAPAPGLSAPPAPPASGASQAAPMTPPPTGAPSSANATPPAGTAAAPTVPTSGSADEDYQQAQETLAKQNYAVALEQFNAFLQRYPDSANASDAQFWKAKALQGLAQYDGAIAEFEKVRQAYPNCKKVPYAMHQQAVCHGRLGQTERAVELFQAVIKDFPMTPVADQAKLDLKRLQGKQ